jgi:hypothetical protein
MGSRRAGHMSPQLLTKMAGSVAGHDGKGCVAFQQA